MKKTFLIGSLLLNVLLAVLLFIPGKKIPSKKHSFMVTSRQEPVKVAQEDIKRFVDTFATYKDRYKVDFVRAYTISSIDMLEVMGLDTNMACKYDACRAYLGLASDQQFKLYLTPVDTDERDIFLSFREDQPASREIDSLSYVLNLIAPCPNTCDVDSPLYKFTKSSTMR